MPVCDEKLEVFADYLVVSFDKIGTFLPNHDAGCIQVAVDNKWHDRCINDAQAVDTMHF